jgi:hypothetical protein
MERPRRSEAARAPPHKHRDYAEHSVPKEDSDYSDDSEPDDSDSGDAYMDDEAELTVGEAPSILPRLTGDRC